MQRLLSALICSIGFALAWAGPAQANPVIPQDLPDPTILKVGGTYYASGTSGSLAPVFPLWKSTDLRTWTRIGNVLPEAPEWARGAFWAPELVQHGGKFFLYYSASEKGGKPCIAVATADRPEGPWTEEGRILCRPGGVIDAGQPVTDVDGTRYMSFKAMGAGQGLYLQRLSEDGLTVYGPEQLTIYPDASWERGVTEGPALTWRNGFWYLFYSGGNCCRPPCTYAQGVARSPTLAGPWEKHPNGPIMTGGGAFKCLGHGTLFGDHGSDDLRMFHHGYRVEDLLNRRRQAMMSRVAWGADGWPSLGLMDSRPATPAGWTDGFGGLELGPHWEWQFDQIPERRVERSELRMRCYGRTRLAARQVELDRFTAVVVPARVGATTTKTTTPTRQVPALPEDGRPPDVTTPTTPSTPTKPTASKPPRIPEARRMIAGRGSDGLLRGVEIERGPLGYRARAFREGPGPDLVGGWRRVASTGEVLVSFQPDGRMSATVGGLRIDVRAAETGPPPTRLAVGCRGTGQTSFASARVRAT